MNFPVPLWERECAISRRRSQQRRRFEREKAESLRLFLCLVVLSAVVVTILKVMA